jgi:hypothetical protein
VSKIEQIARGLVGVTCDHAERDEYTCTTCIRSALLQFGEAVRERAAGELNRALQPPYGAVTSPDSLKKSVESIMLQDRIRSINLEEI